MTYNSTLSLLEYSFTTNDLLVRPMIIFNNNTGQQTSDLKLVNNGIYDYNGIKRTNTSTQNTYIDSIEPEYYNLQGIKVPINQLTSGIYIRRKGSNITKIFIK